MNKYIIKFIEIFQAILEQYEFNIRSYEDDDYFGTIVMYNDKFELHFTMKNETTDVVYYRLLPNNQVLEYNISSFIVSVMTDYDKIIDNETEEEENKYTILYNRNIHSLKYCFNTLNNHFTNLLSGSEHWVKQFKKSKFYSEPIIRERRL